MAHKIVSGDILTNEQLSHHLKVFAGPGAGKTHFLVENIKQLISTHPSLAKSKSRKILCITYTNAAVREIQNRLDRYSGAVEIHTIHGFIIEFIIKPFQSILREIMAKDFTIDVKGKGAITSQIEGLGILHGFDKEEIYEAITGTSYNELSYSKKIMGEVQVDINKYDTENEEFSKLMASQKFHCSSKIDSGYVLPLKKYIWSKVRKLTHDEILYFGYRILEENSTALYAIRVQFPFIFVDEFQDTNPLQTKLIKLIAQKSTIVGVIGDVAQSIYSFQGAKPSQFQNFSVGGHTTLDEYLIEGNRRSSPNIVNFCNFLRQYDDNIKQISIRSYESDEKRSVTEQKKIQFIVGNSHVALEQIAQVVEDGGVVLTRTWAAAFSYIRGVSQNQVGCLTKIYNSYYTSPIEIRRDIEEFNHVLWVKAFKIIFGLWTGHISGAANEMLKTISMFTKIDNKNIVPKHLVQLRSLSEQLFNGVTKESTDVMTTDIINKFNDYINTEEFTELRALLGGEVKIDIFSELDSEDLENNVRSLNWQTSYKLFTEVFSLGSKYMTVHQAKGLEWDKVVVSVDPNPRSDRDAITLQQMYEAPKLMDESSSDEFTRMYYVACSRAKSNLYIHLPEGFPIGVIDNAFASYRERTGQRIEYEFLPG